MNILTFTLQQHTPMLHFQASQQGATLRASDVKPRFDRWLIEKVWGNEFDKCCSYLVGYSKSFSKKQKDDFREKFKGGYRALNYKMRIECSGDKTYTVKMKTELTDKKHKLLGLQLQTTPAYPSRDHSLVMSNIGGRLPDEVFNFIFYDNVNITLRVEQKVLLDAINENFAKFISCVNFGNRKSKGFGSFTINDNSNGVQLYDSRWYLNITLGGEPETEIKNDQAYKDMFTIINKIWRILKSNYKGKSPKDKESVLLGKAKYNRFSRIPSPITFKPILLENSKTCWKFAIGLIYEQDVITKACKSGSENDYNAYVTKLSNNLAKRLANDRKVKLFNTLEELTITSELTID